MDTVNALAADNPVTAVDPLAKALANTVIAARFLFKKPSLLSGLESYVNARHAGRYADSAALSVPVRTLDENRVAIAEIGRQVRQRQQPLHLPGFASDCRAVQHWDTQYFKERFGSIVLPATTGDHYDDMTLADIVDMVENGDRNKQKYLQAVANLFIQHRELYQELPMGKVFQLQQSGFHGAELFMGGPGTGSPWHAANEWTFFVMVSGKKKWKFVKPEFTLHMDPMFQTDLIYVVSRLGNEDPPNITTYDVTIEEGDMLIFPAWWWHRVENVTPTSIGVAVRFRTLMQQIKSPNPLLSLLQLTTLQQWKNNLLERSTGRHKDDERYLRRALRMIS